MKFFQKTSNFSRPCSPSPAALGASTVRNLSVDELADVDAVAFLLDRRRDGSSRGTATGRTWVSDLWQKDTQRLVVRFVTTPRAAPPGARRPDGRE